MRRGMHGLREAAAGVLEANPTENRSDALTITETKEMRAAYLAGFVCGRGGFGDDGGRLWLYYSCLDHEIAREALNLWGGHIIEKTAYNGGAMFKFTAGGAEVLEILKAMHPHLRGVKRQKAEEILEEWKAAA